MIGPWADQTSNQRADGQSKWRNKKSATRNQPQPLEEQLHN